ncbi:MAG: hypothetical protein WC373_04170 [Smithella sp.]|jgi:hypothetical protein
MQLIHNINFLPDPQDFYFHLRIAKNSRHANEFDGLLKEAVTIARPKAAYRVCEVVHLSEEELSINNIRFESRLLSQNLHGTVYPFAVTAGRELAEFAARIFGTLPKFWIEYIQNMVLYFAVSALESNLPLANLSCMNPGSLPDWEIEQQRELFVLLGDIPSALGIHLNQDCLIEPLKTITGIYFYSDSLFCNCSQCNKENCPTRRIAFQRQS